MDSLTAALPSLSWPRIRTSSPIVRVSLYLKLASKSHAYAGVIADIKAKIARTLKEYQQKRPYSALTSHFGTDKSQPLRMAELSGKSLSDLASQFLYKIESFQGKLGQGMGSIEEALIKQGESLKLLKNELALLNESARAKESNLMSEVDGLRQQLAKAEGDLRAEDLKAVHRLEDTIAKLKEEHRLELARIQEGHRKSISELNDLRFSEQKALETKLMQAATHGSKLDELNEYTARLETVMRAMREKLKEFYDKQRPLQSSWKEEESRTEVEEILYTEFVLHCAAKLSNDNKWLVERLAEFGKENELLKENLAKSLTIPNQEIIKEVNSRSLTS